MTDEPREHDAPEVLARRQLEQRTPFFVRLRPAVDDPAGHDAPVPPSPAADSTSRTELAGRLPFFLRRWWLRHHVGGETFPRFGIDLHTLPLGSQYSDPFCDVGSSDIGVF
jgi:hypothetical protein